MERTNRGLKYFVLGDGPEALICHPSLGLGRFLFYRLIPPLSRQFTVISYDPRGIGDNAQLEPALDAWVDDVGDLMELMGKPAYLMGVSLGTWVMARAAVRWPQRVLKLVLMGTTVGFFNGDEAVCARRQELEQVSMADFARQYAETTLMPGVDTEVKAQMAEQLEHVDPAKYLEAMAAIYLTDNRAVFSRVGVPTLILAGSQDVRTPPAMADQAGELIQDSRVYIIPQAGHLALVDQPVRVEELIEGFLLRGTLDD